ncbi:MAG TPA: homocysteine S-methyltransferase [Pseudonocardiaceae bacterium]
MGVAGAGLGQALAERVLVLDGGLATELEAAGHDLSDELWSARLLRDDPDAITAVHRAWVAAGADVLITASYQASFEGFGRVGVPPEETTELLRRSVSLARAASPADRQVWVAGSIGPYGATLADGSEYRGRYGRGIDELAEFHRRRMTALTGARPDVLALETVPDVLEARALLKAAEDLPDDLPVWLSYTIDGDHTRAGQPLDEAFELVTGVDRVIAVGVNCCRPEDVTPAIKVASAVTGKPVVAYPNSGEGWDAAAGRWCGPATFSAARVGEWIDAGARLIGGCCRVGPDQIAALRHALSTA